MSNTWLNDAAPKQIFRDIDLQLLMFDKRIEYNTEKKITFSSSYYCRDILPKQIIMEELIKPRRTRNIRVNHGTIRPLDNNINN